MYTSIIKAKEDNRLISLYTDLNNMENFHIVYVLNVKDGQVLEMNVGLHGEFDGYMVEFLDDIYRIEQESIYQKRIEKLSSQPGKFVKPFEILYQNNPMIDLLNAAMKNNIISNINIGYEENILGYITDIEDEKVFISQITEEGEFDGRTVIYVKNIKKVIIGDVDTQDIDVLVKLNEKQERTQWDVLN